MNITRKKGLKGSVDSKHRPGIKNSEQGIALALVLLTGTALMIGVSALLIRQLSAKKLGVAESYQQIAETAAMNGFNRILATLNSTDSSSYRGYLFAIDNIASATGTSWANPYPDTSGRRDLCSKISLPQTNWPLNEILLNQTISSIRGNAKGGRLETFYSLRSYSETLTEINQPWGTFQADRGTGTFEIEGLVKQLDPSTNQWNEVGRALLTRTISLETKITSNDQWAVIAAQNIDPSGIDIRINGPGRVLWSLPTTTTIPFNCNVPATPALSNRIWPILNQAIPTGSIFNLSDYAIDSDTRNNQKPTRVWSFDDTKSTSNNGLPYGIPCGEDGLRSIICTRPAATQYSLLDTTNPLPPGHLQTDWEESNPLPSTGRYVSWKEEDGIFYLGECIQSKKKACQSHQYQKNDHFLWKPQTKVQPVVWRVNTNGEEEIGYCTKVASEKPGLLEDNCPRLEKNEYNNEDQERLFDWFPIAKQAKQHILKLTATELCQEKSQASACHIYVEHLNLERTTLLIETTEQRPIVLHFELPSSQTSQRGDLTQIYMLASSSKLCGVDIDSTACNERPELFAITSGSGQFNQCMNKSNELILELDGGEIPAAVIVLTKGMINAKKVLDTKGFLWANAMCSSDTGAINLTTSNSMIDEIRRIWKWNERGFDGIGQTTIKGVRGEGFDIFKRY